MDGRSTSTMSESSLPDLDIIAEADNASQSSSVSDNVSDVFAQGRTSLPSQDSEELISEVSSFKISDVITSEPVNPPRTGRRRSIIKIPGHTHTWDTGHYFPDVLHSIDNSITSCYCNNNF